ncbi:actin-related protein 2/3 complex subunit 5-C [Bombus vosnesenskii]|uniref:Actin-related protein 2/3 complex subunit 5 n=3 Tax=Pyrobombus TaxID=144703 RepID=A0A6J3KM89_9HYME|nr:actin-related protein 2/3 complex subunit 5-C [Bombus impatiens]XP_033185196.1 actin-related protein 2/3 complex subunit 5-C [Bombus vancouverensis nearcticus]XP_033302652.1 actin-related protein 2/3 complex subunit 5-C [Bombus bifarius]XP_033354328.1 actin-related protein 2/3 complex subunit 5-C [Bombus vosnesenskii]XP_043578627.1 actin-related protein 2/3 complex subunit 5-C [Bombus pyrosoma]XP_050473230.1 actin-related protein 2/3 complex subunit 5-C [Bombus huntii]XP_060812180.1 actin-
MSRNDGKKDSSASAFRKIDVDQYSDNNFREEDADGGIGGPTGPDENEILTLLSQGKNAEALISVLRSAPLGCKNQQVKDNARNLTLKVLLSIKSTQIDDCLAQLDRDLLDVLMKYIYRGFEIPTEGSSSHLLTWHEKVYNISGVGSIVRAFADSKRA